VVSTQKSIVRLVNKDDKIQYEKLMRNSFGSAKGFNTGPEVFKWSSTDEFYPVLGLFECGELAATMRLEWISSEYEFQIKFDELQVPFVFNYPIGYIAKTATAPEFQSKGFNLILRYHALRVFDYWRVCAVTGAMVEGSPRIESMKRLGYFFFKKQKKWNGLFSSEREVMLSVLDGQGRIQSAIELIESNHSELIQKYSVHFSLSEVPMIGKTKMRFPWDVKVLKPSA
jgi:hypothetical protein